MTHCRIGRRGAAQLVALALLFGTLGCGSDTSTPIDLHEPDEGFADGEEFDAGEPDAQLPHVEPPDWAFPPIPRAIETSVVSPVRAGDTLVVSCRLLDEAGEVIEPAEPPEFTVAAFPSASFRRAGSSITAIRAGTGAVRCSEQNLGLVDATPAEVEILPGPAHTSIIEVNTHQVVAGGTFEASCNFLDEFGNLVDPTVDGESPVLAVSPSGDGIEVTGFDATITVADVYQMSCSVPGLTDERHVDVEVLPGLPARIIAAPVPNQPVYALGQVISASWTVTDEYGNVIPNAAVTTSVAPTNGAEGFGTARYRFEEEGTFEITLTVVGDTQSGDPLSTTITVVVNGTGPGINCESPLDGSMVDMAPGAQLNFGGSVADTHGVQSLFVNGSAAAVAPDGTFSVPVPTQWGMNFVELVATDEFGVENSRTCSFLVSDHFTPQASYMDDAVGLKLQQAAIDDGSRAGGITSIGDLLHTVLNSQGLLDQIDDSLNAANPLRPNTCESQTCVFGVCVCWFGYGLEYRDVRVQGARTVSLNLVNGGIRATVSIKDLGINVRVPYTVASIGGSTTGWVNLSDADVALTLDLYLDAANRPRAAIRPNSVSVGVSGISTSFSGLDGAIVNGVVSLFQGTVGGMLEDALRGFVQDSFDDVLDGLMSSLDIDTLGATFDVPLLDGSGTTALRFNLRFSRVHANTSRLNVGIGTRFTPVTTRNSSPTLGVPRQHSTVWHEPTTSRAVAISVYAGLLNHALHALWKGGLFDATIGGASLGGLPAGAEATIATSLPPVVNNLSDGSVKIGLGGMVASIIYPGIFDEPLYVSLGAIASSSVALNGDALSFSGITIDELYFSTPTVSLDASTRAVLENFLRQIVQRFVDTSLNQSLPALPIPTFAIPASLSTYGLPPNAELGIRNATLQTSTSHYILQGNFGVR